MSALLKPLSDRYIKVISRDAQLALVDVGAEFPQASPLENAYALFWACLVVAGSMAEAEGISIDVQVRTAESALKTRDKVLRAQES